jgi:hypothetical protein
MEAQGGEGKDALYFTDLLINVSFSLWMGNSIAHISLRRSSENYVSPSGKLSSGETPFLSFTSSPTDTHNTVADFKGTEHISKIYRSNAQVVHVSYLPTHSEKAAVHSPYKLSLMQPRLHSPLFLTVFHQGNLKDRFHGDILAPLRLADYSCFLSSTAESQQQQNPARLRRSILALFFVTMGSK